MPFSLFQELGQKLILSVTRAVIVNIYILYKQLAPIVLSELLTVDFIFYVFSLEDMDSFLNLEISKSLLSIPVTACSKMKRDLKSHRLKQDYFTVLCSPLQFSAEIFALSCSSQHEWTPDKSWFDVGDTLLSLRRSYF